jgi:hypothetical protein
MKLRFSIRDLLWLTLVIGMAVAWWIDHEDRAAMKKTMRSLRAQLEMSYTVNVRTGERPPDAEVERVLREAGSDIDKIRPPEKQAEPRR